MRRFSQRNSLVTLNEINITPLLDLAFVLLIIFIITRPLIEQNIDLQLPQNMGKPDTRTVDRHNTFAWWKSTRTVNTGCKDAACRCRNWRRIWCAPTSKTPN